ncbi:hypothetical protein P7C73_g5007, partial [Tremellales sp. Uapishka_1]
MDPLSPNNINPSWSNSPEAPIRQLPPLSPSIPKSASSTSFTREPKIFGAPGTGLVSPPPESTNRLATSNGQARESQEPFLRVRIGGLERNRKDLLIRFDASTNLPQFRTTLYRNMQRSYVEFQRFAEQAQLCNPQTIIPALPLASTSALTDEEDDRLVRIALQRWFTRICEDAVLLNDDELRAFIEADFGYSPVAPPSARRVAASSSVPLISAALSKVVRRGPQDEDEELHSAKGALERLEEKWGGAAAAIGNVGKSRRALALANTDVGAKLISLATVEPEPHLATAERKIGRVWEQLSSMAGGQSASENVVLSDSLGYQALNARAAKDTLTQRTQILEDSQNSTKSAITKRRNAERLKGSSNVNPSKVDDAISDMLEADKLETLLGRRLEAISSNLHTALRSHSKHTHDDVSLALLEHARMSVMFGRQVLRELEALRPDLARIGTTSTFSTPAQTLPQPNMTPSRPYQNNPPPPSQAQAHPHPQALHQSSPQYHNPPPQPTLPQQDISKSMFLPSHTMQTHARTQPSTPVSSQDPLGGQRVMAQSMMLPGPARGGMQGRGGTRRLDEKQAAKLLAGGF